MAETTTNNESVNRPYKPGKEEEECYFFGLSGDPRLVARTSCDVWTRPRDSGWPEAHGQMPKRHRAIRNDDPAVPKWTADLSIDLIKLLEPFSWSYFFPIRLPLWDSHLLETEKRATEAATPIILLIAVVPDGMTWETGIEMATRCRQRLWEQDIRIEVEVCEGVYERHAVDRETENIIDDRAWEPLNDWLNPLDMSKNPHHAMLPMLSLPGYPVEFKEDYCSAGTVGLHIALGNDPRVYGLTCRHVVQGDRPAAQEFRASNEVKKQFHCHGTDFDIAKVLSDLETHMGLIEAWYEPLRIKKRKWEDMKEDPELEARYRLTDYEERRLRAIEPYFLYTTRLIENQKRVQGLTKEQRVLGHVAYYPPLEVSSLIPGCLRDWALIELDEDKYPKGFKNQAYFWNRCFSSLPRVFQLKVDIGGLLDLKLPQDGARDRYAEVHGNSRDVAKFGKRTGLTGGTTSAIEAVVREPKDDMFFAAWELLIVPFQDKSMFSARGDSGASVFDGEGEVVGMVTGSARVDSRWRRLHRNEGDQDGPRMLKRRTGKDIAPEQAAESRDLANWAESVADITFATPINWLLEDIESFTGQKPRLVG